LSEEPPVSIARYRLALLAAGLLWSLGGLIIKSLPVSAMGITFYRSLFAALCLIPLLRGKTLPKLTDSLIGIGMYATLLFSYVASTQGTTAANAIFLQYTAPIYAMVFGPWLFREPANRRDLVTLVIAMFGMALLFFGSFQGGERVPLLLGALSGLMFGFFILWQRRLRYAHPIAVTTTNNLGVAVIAGLVLAYNQPADLGLPVRAVSDAVAFRHLGTLVVMGALQFALPYVLFSYGLRGVGGVEASLLLLVEPLLNPFWVALGVREVPSTSTMAGGAIILGALVLRYVPFRQSKPPS
jgi:drug/metabolite transporter, DME family